MVMEGIISGIAVSFISAVAKGAGKGIKGLLKKEDTKAILNNAYDQFKNSSLKLGGKADDKSLRLVFEEFFGDDRIVFEFRLALEGNADKVDFHMLEEIFAGICLDKGLDFKDKGFEFYRAMKEVLEGIEALAKKEKSQKGAIHLEDLDRVYKKLEKRGQERNITFARQKYLRQLDRHNKRLVFTGIPDPREKQDIELPSVFVMQRAVENVPVKDYRRLSRERVEETGEAFSGDEAELHKMMAEELHDRDEKKEPVKFDTVLKESDNPRYVILGSPGSGKSSLLKFLMLQAVRLMLENPRETELLPLPILVEIRKLEKALGKTGKTDYNILDYLYTSIRQHYNLGLPEKFFETYLDTGRALLLFDGLDEVAEEDRRVDIRGMISAFVTGYHPGNTVIVTSRIAGYSRAQFSTTEYRHFTLEDFNEDEIDTFLRRWYQSRLTNKIDAQKQANELKEALEKKPRIKELAMNPLLLTIIGIIHRYEAQLPEDRLVLYDKAAESLLWTWENVKGLIDERFREEDRRRFLEKVAFHMQSIEKGDDAGTVIHRSELYKILIPDFCRIFGHDNRQAKGLVDEFIEAIRLRAGLLVEQSPDHYGFVHKTFQEYFAAKHIANEAMLNFDLDIMKDYVDKYIDNAFWQETLLLALRALPEKQTKKVLDFILERNPEIEEIFYRNHYFVMKFIAEQGSWLGDRGFVEKQIHAFILFSWNDGDDKSYFDNKTWGRFMEWLETVTDVYPVELLKRMLVTRAEDQRQDVSLRLYCAEALGRLGFKDQATAILLVLAEDQHQHVSLRRDCTDALGRLGFNDKVVTDSLLVLAEDQRQDVSLRRYCAKVLGRLGLKDEEVTDRLMVLTEDQRQEISLRRYCASAVARLGFKDKEVIDRLMVLAEDQRQEISLRRDCAEAIGRLGVKDKEVTDRLLALVEDQRQEISLRRDCAFAVGRLGFKDEEVTDRLLVLAEDQHQDVFLRRDCASAVGRLDFKDKEVTGRLLVLAEDQRQDVSLRRYCAEALGRLGFKDRAAAILMVIAEDQRQDVYPRRDCASAVGRLGFKDQAAEILLVLAEDQNQKVSLRRDCASAAGRLGFKDKKVTDRLLVLAEDQRQDVSLRRYCADALGRLGFKDKEVTDRLLVLAEDQRQDVSLRHYCAYAVGRLGFKDEEVTDRLLVLAEDQSQGVSLRRYCASAAGRLGFKDKAVPILVKLYLDQKDKTNNDARQIYSSLWELTAI